MFTALLIALFLILIIVSLIRYPILMFLHGHSHSVTVEKIKVPFLWLRDRIYFVRDYVRKKIAT